MSSVNKKTPRERMIERIEATKIVKRVNDCALGKDEMTAIELQAAKMCMAKVVPDLKQIEMKMDAIVKVEEIKRTVIDPKPTDS